MFKRLLVIMALLTFTFVLTTGCDNNSDGSGGLQGMIFGKNITITITDNETIDAEHLQKVLDGEVKKEMPYFDLWDNDELKKMIDYMNENNYIIIPGQYTFNQAWNFESGLFVLNNGEKREVFKFEKNS